MSVSLVIAIGLVGSVAGFWHQVCNERTYRERTGMARLLFAEPDWQRRVELFEQVSYGRHLWHRFFLLDPWALYDPRMMGRAAR